MELTSKQRAQLRAMANTMEAILQIGKDGIGDNLIKQAYDALEARELVKVTVLKNAPYETREACDMLCESVGAAPVQCIGQKFVMYKPSRKHKTIELVKK
ncbi:MAG: ribosome assembly RNA-binding protein YhbY [Clostridiales bacterium]|nr:ribosome assembly RNA-binding protein YhbY [Clostridiales bacterium]MBQ2816762.1 ribosome assembly RNA-binding protein YhbY [Clostridia bacterium]